jgi:hypothetical protein
MLIECKRFVCLYGALEPRDHELFIYVFSKYVYSYTIFTIFRRLFLSTTPVAAMPSH